MRVRLSVSACLGAALAALALAGDASPWTAAAFGQESPRGILLGRLRDRLNGVENHGTPATPPPAPQLVSAIRIAGLEVAVWRPPQPQRGRVPLVIFSHGFHGDATQSTFLTKALAAHGYLVLAPNHKDALRDSSEDRASWRPEVAFTRPDQWTDATYRDRADDILAILKALHADRQWSAAIDWSRVALAGHSLGGYTALGLAGAWPSWKTPEVKAVLALSPYCEPYVRNKSLEKLKVPVMYQGGTRDIGITPFVKRSGGAYEQTPGPAYFVDLEGAGHFAWTDLRTNWQANIVAYSVAFLDRHLRGDRTANPAEKRDGVADLRAK